jgi:hypothetical protein
MRGIKMMVIILNSMIRKEWIVLVQYEEKFERYMEANHGKYLEEKHSK